MSYPFYLRGMEALLADLYENPDLVRRLVDVSAGYHASLVQEAIGLGADFIVLGDDYASTQGLLMKPSHFQEFFLPGLAKVVAAVKQAGGYCFKHTDGYVEPLLDMIVETGIDALHPMERISGMDLVSVKKRYGDRICVGGSVDCTAILSRGSLAEVAEETLYYLREAAPGGGFILMSSNTIHSGVKAENYLTMLNIGRQYGGYPIRLR
jgi:uroporphyrinogen decarboxylase